jgi:hypothetical protein
LDTIISFNNVSSIKFQAQHVANRYSDVLIPVEITAEGKFDRLNFSPEALAATGVFRDKFNELRFVSNFDLHFEKNRDESFSAKTVVDWTHGPATNLGGGVFAAFTSKPKDFDIGALFAGKPLFGAAAYSSTIIFDHPVRSDVYISFNQDTGVWKASIWAQMSEGDVWDAQNKIGAGLGLDTTHNGTYRIRGKLGFILGNVSGGFEAVVPSRREDKFEGEFSLRWDF